MRKLLCGIAAGFLLLWVPGVASAQESSEPEVHTDAGAAEEEHLSHEAEECIHILEDGGDPEDCHESPSPILPASNEVLWGGLSFFVLFLVMAKFGVPAAKSMIDARTTKIQTDIDEAERARAEAETLKAEYERQLADARQQASRIVEEARQQAEQVRRDLTARAEAEATELRQRNAEQAAAERDRVMGEVQGQVAQLAIELAEKVVESSLDRETNLRLIESYITGVGSRSN